MLVYEHDYHYSFGEKKVTAFRIVVDKPCEILLYGEEVNNDGDGVFSFDVDSGMCCGGVVEIKGGE